MNKKLWMMRIRNVAGFLGMILPWLCLFGFYMVSKFGTIGLKETFPDSMSITYYVSPVLAMVLTAASIVLMCYDGYDLQDNLVTTISGVFGILIVLFPCGNSNGVFEALHITSNAGYFQTPIWVNKIIHNTSAGIFFCLLAYNSMFLFTKGDGNPTLRKKIRNCIYKICAVGMIIPMLFMIIPVSIPHKTFWVEAVALTFFGISWLTKG
ncbi:hypothetical protein, partial [Treponema sp.]|uniref:hypothetical protein n=1 Tax=Treponema sp. TaxID=166 RepID=UPI0025FFE57B